ncbi:MAG: PD40 domain-containing protein [Phycisphaerae bacterium]|nr:PD40 domain-containing protein [Phycisphaerae bacterium]
MKRLILCVFVLTLLSSAVRAADEARLLRFPAIHGSQIVFTYAGDLYTVAAKGGVARKLTGDVGFEMFARFSPDGKQLAFTAQYDGNTEVYVMPAAGGVPKRVTWTATLERDDVSDRMGPNNIVMAWTNDGRIVFRSRMRSFNSFNGRLYAVSPEGGMPEELPLPRGGFCSFSADGAKMAYNRIFREFRTWKRYRGGMADDVWIYDFETKKVTNITDNPAQDIIPMWKGDTIYFLSDRDANKRMNLFAYDLATKETKQLTDFADYDIKWPSLGDKAIVFENGGNIYRYNLDKGRCEKVTIRIQEDRVGGRGGIMPVSGAVTNYEIAPDGKRALFGARGDVFTVPAKHGEVRNLTATPGVHERNSTWSPDGKWVAYISDATGEDEIYVTPGDGSGPPRQVTQGGDTYKYEIRWSPDSTKILWGDKRLRLHYAKIDTGEIIEVDTSAQWEFHEYAWSPDSKWVVYVRAETEGMSRICLYSLDQKQSWPLTDGWYDVADPSFSSDGRFVLFVSNRDFHPIYSRTEWNHAYQDMERIYLLTLAKETRSPFAYESDEVAVRKPDDTNEKKAKDDKDADKGKADEKTESSAPVKIDLDGIGGRIAVLPIAVSDYRRVQAVGDMVYYLRSGSADDGTTLRCYDLKEKKETELGKAHGYEISADGKKMLVSAQGKYAIIDLPKTKFEMKETLNLSGMEVTLDRQAEWTQIFNECWRQMRDFLYVPNMHGVDWEGMRNRYAPLVNHVTHRADLTYVIGEMISELNVGHTYVGGGDMPKPRRIGMGLLGAQVSKDKDTGWFRIDRILPGQNWDKSLRSPLTEIGVDARQGDYILAVDGVSTADVKNIYELLFNKAGRQVALRLNAAPTEEGARDVIVLPTGDESGLYYFDWVQTNIAKVDKATGGKVGYIHVPDMGPAGLNEFVKHFYPQIRKKALIIDVRGNGGGNVSPMLIERLRREIAMITFSRDTAPRPNPSELIYGPMVCLADEFSASDGDLFTYRFKKYKLGKVVGKRTWGGVVGIRGSLPLLDGGYLNKPEFSRYDVDGKEYIIEGVGVEPDIEVDNDPAKEYAGIDQQLDRAVKVILKELKTKEKTIPPLPPYPVK